MATTFQEYKVVITAPDGRFGTKIIEGGLDKKSAEFEAKKYRDLGMIVSVHPVPKEEPTHE